MTIALKVMAVKLILGIKGAASDEWRERKKQIPHTPTAAVRDDTRWDEGASGGAR